MDISNKYKREKAVRSKPGVVKIDDVEVIYKSKDSENIALTRTSLTIEAGQFICILGPSGCGKSTLLNVVAGFIAPTSGNAFLDEQLISQPGSDRGMVFQQHTLFPWKTVRENIELGPRLINDIEASKTVDYFLEMIGLAEYSAYYPDQLSGGMQQRVGIARALATYPKVLLMDEPFAALDYQTRLVMQENLLNLWSKFSSTMIFVTHDVDEAVYLSDRIIVMSSSPGRVVADISNPFSRPRNKFISSEPEFASIKRQCMELICNQTLKAM